MPFNTLLLTCLIPGASVSEHGGRVSVKPQSGEIVLFFVVDDQTNRDSTLRQDLGIVGAICDCVVYYIKGDKKVLCLVELKGSNVDHAVEQIMNTFQYLKQSLEACTLRRECRSCFLQIDWRAYVYVHGSVPRNTKQASRFLTEAFRKTKFAITRERDLGSFLRE